MIGYDKFVRVFEAAAFVVGLRDVRDLFKEIFDDKKVTSVGTKYEKNGKNNTLVISINNLFFEKTNIIHTKFIFPVDEDHKKLTEDKFQYLYDINSQYKEVSFTDLDNLKKKLTQIVLKRQFGKDLINLSDLSVTMSSDVNEWLRKNEVENTSVFNVTYSPLKSIVPSDSMTFRFDINVEDTRFLIMTVKKTNINKFNISFREGDWSSDIDTDSLKSIPQCIGDVIKKHIVK